MKTNKTAIAVKLDTYEMLQSIKSCFQLKYKKNYSFDEIIKKFLMTGIEQSNPEIFQIMNLINNTETSSEEFEVKEQETE